jgi:predicted nucleic acid-binding protein
MVVTIRNMKDPDAPIPPRSGRCSTSSSRYGTSSEAVISDEHRLLAPTLLRSQMLSLLYRAVRQRETTKKDADRQLNYLRALRIRLLGDRVLQNVAWKIAGQLGWADTLDAEYVALTQLQADAFVTLDAQFAHTVKGLVMIAPIEALS